MQHARMTVALFAFTAMAGAAAAQEAQKAALPDTTPCLDAIAGIATCYGVKHETGAYITAAVPKNWNGHLVVFAHGGPSLLPPTATGSNTDLDKYAYAVRRGFAWVASSYRREGYGGAMAAADTHNAPKVFLPRVGERQRNLLHSAADGGP